MKPHLTVVAAVGSELSKSLTEGERQILCGMAALRRDGLRLAVDSEGALCLRGATVPFSVEEIPPEREVSYCRAKPKDVLEALEGLKRSGFVQTCKGSSYIPAARNYELYSVAEKGEAVLRSLL